MPPEYKVFIPDESNDFFEATVAGIRGSRVYWKKGPKGELDYPRDDQLAQRIKDFLATLPGNTKLKDLTSPKKDKWFKDREDIRTPQAWVDFLNTITPAERGGLAGRIGWFFREVTQGIPFKLEETATLEDLQSLDWEGYESYYRENRLPTQNVTFFRKIFEIPQ